MTPDLAAMAMDYHLPPFPSPWSGPAVGPVESDDDWLDRPYYPPSECRLAEFVGTERPAYLACASCPHVGPPSGFASRDSYDGPICRECFDAGNRQREKERG